jgi:hypothetical protein
MAVVRLRRRKWAERDRKRPEMGLAAAARGSDKWPEKPTFCGFPTAGRERKKNVPMGVLADREDLWSNPLNVGIQRLSITFHLMD